MRGHYGHRLHPHVKCLIAKAELAIALAELLRVKANLMELGGDGYASRLDRTRDVRLSDAIERCEMVMAAIGPTGTFIKPVGVAGESDEWGLGNIIALSHELKGIKEMEPVPEMNDDGWSIDSWQHLVQAVDHTCAAVRCLREQVPR